MDLSSINLEQSAEQGAFLHFEHPVTGEKLYTEKKEPIGLVMVGTDSARYRNKVSELGNKRLRKRNKNPTIEQAEQDAAEILAACTLSAKNVVIDGEKIEGEEALRHMFRNHRWIKEQADEFVGDRSNFFLTA